MIDSAKKALNFFLKNKLRVICVLIAVSIILSAVNFLKNSKNFSATFSLNYSEAADGLNPNNSRFNSYEIVSDTVLENAIKLCGLENDLSPQELKSCLSISQVDTGNAAGDSEYISTTYRINFNGSSVRVKNVKSIDILKNVCYAYRQFFMENYGDNQSLLKADLSDKKMDEPYIRINEIKTSVNQLARYLQSRLNENKTYTDSETGLSFTEIDKELSNIINYDIPNTMAFIVEEGIANDSSSLTQILEYKNKIEKILYDKSLADYNADRGGIDMYETDMSSVIMIPTQDNTDDYYMSRTKTAMDYMARSADAEADDITVHDKEIVSTKYVIDCIAAKQGNAANVETANKMIDSLESAINDLSDRFLKLDKSYIEYKSRNYINFVFGYMSFIDKIEIKNVVIDLIIFIALWYVLLTFKYSLGAKKACENLMLHGT